MTYTCDKCKSKFKELQTTLYQEYPGGCFVEDYVNPCCTGASYTEE